MHCHSKIENFVIPTSLTLSLEAHMPIWWFLVPYRTEFSWIKNRTKFKTYSLSFLN